MASITLQDLARLAHDFQDSKEANPKALASILTDFSNQMNAMTETAPLDIKMQLQTQVERIVTTREIILQMGLGQLSFWGQMVEVEALALNCLNQAGLEKIRVDEEFAKTLGDFYHILFSVHQDRLDPSNHEETSVSGLPNMVIAEYTRAIQELVKQLPGDIELNEQWAEVLNEPNRAVATVKLRSLIKSITTTDTDSEACITDEQIASLENAAGSPSVAMLEQLLKTLPIYDLTAADKLRIVKKAIDQPNLSPLNKLFEFDCFNEMSFSAFEQAITYAGNSIGHLLILQCADGYVKGKSKN
jgi:hypothetical protein